MEQILQHIKSLNLFLDSSQFLNIAVLPQPNIVKHTQKKKIPE